MYFLTLTEVARILRTNPSKLSRFIISGQLPAFKVDKEWLIDKIDLQEFIIGQKYYSRINLANRAADLGQLIEDCEKAPREGLEQYAKELMESPWMKS